MTPEPSEQPRTSERRDRDLRELRALCEKEEQGFPIKPLGVLEAKRLEERSGAMFKKERNHRAKSTDALALAARGPEPLR